MRSVAASFVIPTRGRNAQLVELLRSIERQSVTTETLVMDDAGSPELAALLAREFPSVRYYAIGTGRGPTFQRNRGIDAASAEIVFPLDDDATLPSPHTVEQTLAEFNHPRVVAVAIPYVNIRYDSRVRQRAPDADTVWVEHAFIGASHALRRSAFLRVGGYREHFLYMGEEGDLCLRLLSLGYVVRAGTADPIHHHESPIRNSALADYCGRRNDILFAWHNVPAGALAVHLAGTTWNGLKSSLRASNRIRSFQGLLVGYRDIVRLWHARRPVSTAAYRLHRELKTQGPCRLVDIQSQLTKVAALEP